MVYSVFVDKQLATFYRRLGRRVRDLRKYYLDGSKRPNALTQDDLAERLGIHRQTVANMETGRTQIPLHMLYQICELLDIDLARLLEPVEPMLIEALGYQDQEEVVAVKGGVAVEIEGLAEEINKLLQD